jgi:hypothetical protein
MSSQSKPGSFVKAVLLTLFFALPPVAAKAIVLDVFKTSGDGASLITPDLYDHNDRYRRKCCRSL